MKYPSLDKRRIELLNPLAWLNLLAKPTRAKTTRNVLVKRGKKETCRTATVDSIEASSRKYTTLTKARMELVATISRGSIPIDKGLADLKALDDKMYAIMEAIRKGTLALREGKPTNPAVSSTTKPKAVIRYKEDYGAGRSVFFVEYEFNGERYVTGTVVRGTDRSLGWYFGKGGEGGRKEGNRIALLSDKEFSKAEDDVRYSWEKKKKALLKPNPDLAAKSVPKVETVTPAVAKELKVGDLVRSKRGVEVGRIVEDGMYGKSPAWRVAMEGTTGTRWFLKSQVEKFERLPTLASVKEPWQMTGGEYMAWYRDEWAKTGVKGVPADTQWAGNKHKFLVKQALSEGKPVPAEVLADYPELATKAKPPVGAIRLDLLPEGWEIKIHPTEKGFPLAEANWADKELWVQSERIAENSYTVNHEIAHIIIEPKFSKLNYQRFNDAIKKYGIASAEEVDAGSHGERATEVVSKYISGRKLSSKERTFVNEQFPELGPKPTAKAKPPVTVPSEAAKEPWQMTQAEYVDYLKETLTPEQLKEHPKAITSATRMHQVRVAEAIRQGKPVPPEVLADYPDLAAKAEYKPKSGATRRVVETLLLDDGFGPKRYDIVENEYTDKGTITYNLIEQSTGNTLIVKARSIESLKAALPNASLTPVGAKAISKGETGRRFYSPQLDRTYLESEVTKVEVPLGVEWRIQDRKVSHYPIEDFIDPKTMAMAQAFYDKGRAALIREGLLKPTTPETEIVTPEIPKVEAVIPETAERRFVGVTKSTEPTQVRAAPWRVAFQYKGKEYARYFSSREKVVRWTKEKLGVELDPKTLEVTKGEAVTIEATSEAAKDLVVAKGKYYHPLGIWAIKKPSYHAAAAFAKEHGLYAFQWRGIGSFVSALKPPMGKGIIPITFKTEGAIPKLPFTPEGQIRLLNPVAPERIELVHLWDPLTTRGALYAVFVDGKYEGIKMVAQPKTGIKVYRGKERTTFLQSKGLVIDPETKQLRSPKR